MVCTSIHKWYIFYLISCFHLLTLIILSMGKNLLNSSTQSKISRIWASLCFKYGSFLYLNICDLEKESRAIHWWSWWSFHERNHIVLKIVLTWIFLQNKGSFLSLYWSPQISRNSLIFTAYSLFSRQLSYTLRYA